ncbi:M48 family metallopeptidase [Thermodesulfobacteriota bacterium]
MVQLPVQCIEYVIMHELCHLKFPNHSKLFYSFLTRCLPDWRKRKETDRVRLS